MASQSYMGLPSLRLRARWAGRLALEVGQRARRGGEAQRVHDGEDVDHFLGHGAGFDGGWPVVARAVACPSRAIIKAPTTMRTPSFNGGGFSRPAQQVQRPPSNNNRQH